MPFIYSNFTKRFILTSYGGKSFSTLTGYVEVLTNGIPTYYLTDWSTTRVVIFDQYWNYQSYKSLPLSNSFALVYVNDYFYIASDLYFYKTDTNFTLVASYNSGSTYRGLYYDSSTSLFYVCRTTSYQIHVFTTSLSLKTTISLGTYEPHGIQKFNRNFYVSTLNYNIVIVLQNNLIIKYYYISSLCSNIGLSALYIDLNGYMSITCQYQSYLILYDYNGNYMNQYMSIASGTTYSNIDSKGRFIVTSYGQIAIYY